MKIVAFLGSPRLQGNTARLLRRMLEGATSQGAETTLFELNCLNIKGCQACQACRTHEGCAVDDDMTSVYRAIREADAVVIGSPVFMFQLTAQTKALLDRFYVFLNPDFTHRLGRGKKTVLLFSQSDADVESFKSCFDSTEKVLKILGFPVARTLVAPGLTGAKDIEGRQDLLDAAFEIGAELASAT